MKLLPSRQSFRSVVNRAAAFFEAFRHRPNHLVYLEVEILEDRTTPSQLGVGVLSTPVLTPPTLQPSLAAPIPQMGVSSITQNFNNTPINAGNTLWFNSVLNVQGLNNARGPVEIHFDSSSITLNGVTRYVPGALITFDPAAKTATTSYETFDPQFNAPMWVTTVPLGRSSGNVFLDGYAWQISGANFPGAGALPGGVQDVTWTGHFETDTPGITLSWKWAAVEYPKLFTSADNNSLGVKPVDGFFASQYHNFDLAGTPENLKALLLQNAPGGGSAGCACDVTCHPPTQGDCGSHDGCTWDVTCHFPSTGDCGSHDGGKGGCRTDVGCGSFDGGTGGCRIDAGCHLPSGDCGSFDGWAGDCRADFTGVYSCPVCVTPQPYLS